MPLDRLAEAIDETVEIGRRHGLVGLQLGPRRRREPALDVPVRPRATGRAARAPRARGEELFELAVRLGGSVSGEHGTGWLKRGQLAQQWPPARRSSCTRRMKRVFDPKGLLNPGKKLARLPLPIQA